MEAKTMHLEHSCATSPIMADCYLRFYGNDGNDTAIITRCGRSHTLYAVELLISRLVLM